MIRWGCAAAARRALEIAQDWANEGVQWGSAIGRHEAITSKLAWMASHTLAMEAIVGDLLRVCLTGDVDLRLEAAMAKLFNTETRRRLVDELVQVRGGRGDQTADSLRARGEKPYAVERMLRDMRINRIFEGTSEIQRLFIAREAVDPHMKRAGILLDPRAAIGAKAGAVAKAGAHYAWWYPSRFAGWSRYPRFGESRSLLASHGRLAGSRILPLFRAIFQAMMRYQAKLEV